MILSTKKTYTQLIKKGVMQIFNEKCVHKILLIKN